MKANNILCRTVFRIKSTFPVGLLQCSARFLLASCVSTRTQVDTDVYSANVYELLSKQPTDGDIYFSVFLFLTTTRV